MAENASNVEIGYMSHITAKTYHDNGKSDIRVKVDGMCLSEMVICKRAG